VFDKKGIGRLPVKTLQKILKSLRHPFTKDQIAELIRQADVDTQSTVDYREFVKIVLKF
jgi:Ca2+-binding EF-hand superfamily protein